MVHKTCSRCGSTKLWYKASGVVMSFTQDKDGKWTNVEYEDINQVEVMKCAECFCTEITD